ncbi:MAG: hypothetical protein KAI25_01815, partial [Hyphomicrobiaceae bacterium]|nr:hypothetical protein [Hyphomicrobiaceae bacterium]
GGVIGTWSYTLIDGSSLRMPSMGVHARGGANLENLGVKPDVHIENHPDVLSAGRDQQLEEAVKLLLEQLDRAK